MHSRLRWSEILAVRSIPPVPDEARSLFLWGDRAVYHIGLRTGARVVATGAEVAIIDAAMAFDVRPFVAMARAARVAPEIVLRRVHVARAFTCWQLTTLWCDRLDPLLHDHPIGLIILLGPLTPFFDQDVTYKEASFLFQRVLHSIPDLQRTGSRLLIVQTVPLPPTARRWFARDLLRLVDVGLHLRTPNKHWQVDVVKPSVPKTPPH